MRITVIGASGLIGTKVVDLLRKGGHDVVAASRASGADVITGDGLGDALAGANVLVDVTNSPSFEDDPVLAFFTTSTTNLVAAAKAAGVGHYVALSIVGVDGLPESGYMRAKVAQEKLITESSPAVFDRARNAVRGVRRWHHRLDDRGRRGTGARCADPADRRR